MMPFPNDLNHRTTPYIFQHDVMPALTMDDICKLSDLKSAPRWRLSSALQRYMNKYIKGCFFFKLIN